MADYDNWDQPCCGGFPGHRDWCKNSSRYPAYIHKQNRRGAAVEAGGFNYVESSDTYLCLRGCGCVVWNIDDHIKNVCSR